VLSGLAEGEAAGEATFTPGSGAQPTITIDPAALPAGTEPLLVAERPDLLRTAARDGDLGSPLKRLLA
jgi:hypothetical protein